MKPTFPNLQGHQVLVIGDVMLDSFYHGKANRISPEAPVPVVNVERVEDLPGGAANVAMNIASLGANCKISGITGQDTAADTLEQRLNSVGVKCAFHRAQNRDTIIKRRVISNQQQLLRMDFEKLFEEQEWQALKPIAEPLLTESKILVLSDYNKGTLTDPQYWINLAKQHDVPILVDPKGTDFEKYRGADLITPNMTEFEAVVGKVTSEADLIDKAQQLIKQLDIKAILVTRS
ncbi:MAG: bifunctional heptose 7-phosphate kinase/heptose 1-phosphate adenyltransferase, partial [Piscirickettsiaceae bacterium]|nr:bifunctional heptose 7-phosphate kinase/heptose 1-phosphate adenyltransferase [Piscirickettsiaceae bacterium]